MCYVFHGYQVPDQRKVYSVPTLEIWVLDIQVILNPAETAE